MGSSSGRVKNLICFGGSGLLWVFGFLLRGALPFLQRSGVYWRETRKSSKKTYGSADVRCITYWIYWQSGVLQTTVRTTYVPSAMYGTYIPTVYTSSLRVRTIGTNANCTYE